MKLYPLFPWLWSYTLIWCVLPLLPPAIVSRHQNPRRLYRRSLRGNRHVAPTLPRSQVSTTSRRTLSIPPTQTQSRQLQHRRGQARAREAPCSSVGLFWPHTVTQRTAQQIERHTPARGTTLQAARSASEDEPAAQSLTITTTWPACPSAALERPRARVLPVCCLHTDGQLVSAGLSVGASMQAGMCIARGSVPCWQGATRKARPVDRSQRERHPQVAATRGCWSPSPCLAASRNAHPRLHAGALPCKRLGRVPAPDCFRIYPPNFSEDSKDSRGFRTSGNFFCTSWYKKRTLEHEMRNTVWFWYKKNFNSTKQFHVWSAIIGTQYNFRPVLVVKKVLCGSSCIWIDLKTVQMVQNKPTPHKYRPERYKTNPHHTNTVLKKSV